jgi:8-oxo-dGTP pyrophosphatase MutT (NUDIX family)
LLEENKDERMPSAAVMVILTPIENELNVLFTHRTNSVRTHKDQVSLPGGLKENGDQSLLHTAIRETREEIGLTILEHEIIGTLIPVESISNYRIHPFVCCKFELGVILLNKSEVSKIFFIPLKWVLDDSNWQYKKMMTSDGKERSVIIYEPYESEVVWGITANILVDFGRMLYW